MSEIITDEDLRSQLESFKSRVGKINDKNRSILIKKLNHLKARREMSLREKNKEYTNFKTRSPCGFTAKDVDEEFHSPAIKSRKKIDMNLSQNPAYSMFGEQGNTSNNSRDLFSNHLDADDDEASSLNADLNTSKNSLFESSFRSRFSDFRDTSRQKLVTDYSDTEGEPVSMMSIGINTSFPFSGGDDSIQSSPSSCYSQQNGDHNRTFDSTQQSAKFFKLTPSKLKSTGNSHQTSHSTSKTISMAILVIFLSIFFVYCYKAFATSPYPAINDKDTCMHLSTGQVCLNAAERKALKYTLFMLADRAGQAVCSGSRMGALRLVAGVGQAGKAADEAGMTVAQLTNHLRKKFDDVGESEHYGVSVGKLLQAVHANPHWNISVSCQDKDCSGLERVVHSRVPRMSLWCRVRRAVNKITWTAVFITACVVGVVWLCLLLVWLRARRQSKTRQAQCLANQIADLLHKNASQEYSPKKEYLAISDVRDALIPLREQVSKRAVWKNAVELMKKKEARVVQDLVLMDGQDVPVWKWRQVDEGVAVGNNSGHSDEAGPRLPKPASRSTALTSCLKLLNVLPASCLSVSVDVKDSVLDRCGQYHGILHLASDLTFEPGAVFVKCVSEAAAFQNHTALHAWSYQGRLVSVSYVSCLVYEMLFETSVDAVVPLKSTKYRKRSLQRRVL